MAGWKSIYLLSKDGSSLFSYSSGDAKKVDAALVAGFLSAVNSFATEMGWPSGISLIRSGSLECRICPGKQVFSALVVEQSTAGGYFTEPIIEDLATQICQRFEAKYKEEIEMQITGHFSDERAFYGFEADIEALFDQFKAQTFELYQKLILTEAMYAHVPQKWCIPLIKSLSTGTTNDVTGEFASIIKKYPYFKKAIVKVNQEQAQVWDFFGISPYQIGT